MSGSSSTTPNLKGDATASPTPGLQQDKPSTSTSDPLALPEPPTESTRTQLDVSGDGTTVKLDHLGPVVVNGDGSLSRIENWDQMSDIERKNTLRVLGKRNAARLAALRSQGQGEVE
jgi:hypothetical protein